MFATLRTVIRTVLCHLANNARTSNIFFAFFVHSEVNGPVPEANEQCASHAKLLSDLSWAIISEFGVKLDLNCNFN